LALGILSAVLARRMQALAAQSRRFSSKLAEVRLGGRVGEGAGGGGGGQGRGRGRVSALVRRGAEAEARMGEGGRGKGFSVGNPLHAAASTPQAPKERPPGHARLSFSEYSTGKK
jgi:hypothetical protein